MPTSTTSFAARLKPYEDHDASRFSIRGPDIAITSGAVIALALTLNELCTNTTKFGALSVPSGQGGASLGHRQQDPTPATDLDGTWRSGCVCPHAAELWNPHDGGARATIERQRPSFL